MTILGTGAALATGDRVQTGLLVDVSGSTLLVDCGSGVLHRLAGVGRDPTEIDAVLLSHTHLDHVSDLPGLVKARWMIDQSPTQIIGPPGTPDDVGPLFEIDGQSDRVEVSSFETGAKPGDRIEIDVPGTTCESVSATPTVHSRQGVGYRFGTRFGFAGDTEASATLLAFFDGVDVLVHDCAFPSGGEPDNHPTPEALAEALESADPDIDRLYLTHLYPDAACRADEAREIVAEATDAAVHVADDTDDVVE
ncbi:ribonuclease Z [Halalkaliarchaeum desulfuricum]|uniref:Ribonuclease Z n=1 Tax=Halalkaliarchaeum desulfuricum TaxID=2055893 RepID=A0A343TMV8_9EURY|nr:ribonuclease Z [Halalkaliarchaeum desulfuricum]